MAQPAFEVEGFLPELNATTQRTIVPEVSDNVMMSDPLLAMLRANRLESYPGGQSIQQDFLYAAEGGGAFSPGDTFPITRKQTITGGNWQPKQYFVPVTEWLEQINIYNRGPQAAISIIQSKMQSAALTMSARLAIDTYQAGQGARILHLNGLAEICNDGTNATFDGGTYTTYGTVPRNGTIGSALNSPMTGPTANVNGPLSYKAMDEAYWSVVVGTEHPNVMITTNLGLSYINQKFQPEQRFMSQDARIGFVGLQFNQGRIYPSQYAPGTKTVPDGTNLGYNVTAGGETLFFLNDSTFKLYVSDDPLFGFGFTGFKVAQDNLTVAGQYLFAGNITNIQPRFSRVLFNITA